MSWKLEGSYFETCSCDVVCPCTASLALGATRDRCKVTLVFNVKDGEVEGTDVSGLTVAAVADTPRVMSEGNWRLGVFIDAAASDEQAEKLGGVFSGALSGPMEALGPLVGESLGVERAAIEVREDGLRHSIRIGDSVDFEVEDVVPFGVQTGEPARLTGIFHPAGSELTIAHATRSKIDAVSSMRGTRLSRRPGSHGGHEYCAVDHPRRGAWRACRGVCGCSRAGWSGRIAGWVSRRGVVVDGRSNGWDGCRSGH